MKLGLFIIRHQTGFVYYTSLNWVCLLYVMKLGLFIIHHETGSVYYTSWNRVCLLYIIKQGLFIMYYKTESAYYTSWNFWSMPSLPSSLFLDRGGGEGDPDCLSWSLNDRLTFIWLTCLQFWVSFKLWRASVYLYLLDVQCLSADVYEADSGWT